MVEKQQAVAAENTAPITENEEAARLGWLPHCKT
jgi:hypothetical protein